MYAAFDPSFNQRDTDAEIPMDDVALAREAVLRIIGVKRALETETAGQSPSRRRKPRFASLSPAMIKVEEKLPQPAFPNVRGAGRNAAKNVLNSVFSITGRILSINLSDGSARDHLS